MSSRSIEIYSFRFQIKAPSVNFFFWWGGGGEGDARGRWGWVRGLVKPYRNASAS